MCAVAPRHLGKGAQMPPPFHPRLGRLIVCIEQTLSRLRVTIEMVFAERPLGPARAAATPVWSAAPERQAKREEGRCAALPFPSRACRVSVWLQTVRGRLQMDPIAQG